jgi:hypothetical protein
MAAVPIDDGFLKKQRAQTAAGFHKLNFMKDSGYAGARKCEQSQTVP